MNIASRGRSQALRQTTPQIDTAPADSSGNGNAGEPDGTDHEIEAHCERKICKAHEEFRRGPDDARILRHAVRGKPLHANHKAVKREPVREKSRAGFSYSLAGLDF